jgi:hypothetical protein
MAKHDKVDHVVYTLVQTEAAMTTRVCDEMRARVPEAFVRRILADEVENTDNALMVVTRTKNDIIEQIHDLLAVVDDVPGVVSSQTRMGMLTYGSHEVRPGTPVGFMFIRTDLPSQDDPIREDLRSLPGIVHLAKLTGQHRIGLMYKFDSGNISSAFHVVGRINAVLAGRLAVNSKPTRRIGMTMPTVPDVHTDTIHKQ